LSKGKSIVWKKAWLPLYSRGGQFTCRRVGFSQPEWPRARGREKLDCLVGKPAGLVSTSGYGRRELAPYAKACCTVPALFRPWQCNGSGGCSPTPLLGMAYWLSSWPPSWHLFLRGGVVMSSYGESCCPSWAACSPGRDLVAPTLLDRVQSIGFGQNGRAGS
jgi:hypothetical protein